MITELFGANDILTNCLVYGTICLAGGLIATGLFKRSAARAHQVLLLAMIAAVFVPVGVAVVRHYELGVLSAEAPALPAPIAASTIMAELALPMTMELAEPAVQYEFSAVEQQYSEPVVSTVGPAGASLPWRSILVGLWFAASAILLGRLVVTFVLGRRLLKKASRPTCDRIRQAAELAAEKLTIEKPPAVLASGRITSLVIWCWAKRPALLIPRGAEVANNNADWVALFCHELAHLKRLDHISGLFAELLICVFPWQPQVWVAKKRLVALSEQACDDWAVGTAHSDAGYARSLLDMVPQSRMAFAPTVLPNKKHLTARIHRILHGRRSNPRAGRRWAVLAAITAMALAVTISFAQPRPADDRETDRAERREREALERLERGLGEREDTGRLEAAELRERKAHARELQQRAKEIERQIKGLGDSQDAEARELEAELREIRNHIASMKREFGDVSERGLGDRKGDPHFRELMQHREELRHKAGRIQVTLKEHPDHPEKAELYAALGEIEEQMHAIERELRGSGAKGRPVDGRREDAHLKELMRHREELHVRAEQIEMELKELGDKNPDRTHQLRGEMEDIANAAKAVEQELQGVRRGREPGDVEARNREIMQHRAELTERAKIIRHDLKELGDAHPDESHKLRAQLEQIGEQLKQMNDMERSRPDAREPGAGGDKGHLRELMQEREELGRRAGQIERKLEELGDSRSDESQELRKLLEDTRERMRDVDASLRGGARDERAWPRDRESHVRELAERRRELEAHARETEMLIDRFDNEEDKAAERRTLEDIHRQIEAIDRELRGVERRGPGERDDVGNKVDRLRGEVNGLRDQMGEIRNLLERLLERERSQRTDKRRDDAVLEVQY